MNVGTILFVLNFSKYLLFLLCYYGPEVSVHLLRSIIIFLFFYITRFSTRLTKVSTVLHYFPLSDPLFRRFNTVQSTVSVFYCIHPSSITKPTSRGGGFPRVQSLSISTRGVFETAIQSQEQYVRDMSNPKGHTGEVKAKYFISCRVFFRFNARGTEYEKAYVVRLTHLVSCAV